MRRTIVSVILFACATCIQCVAVMGEASGTEEGVKEHFFQEANFLLNKLSESTPELATTGIVVANTTTTTITITPESTSDSMVVSTPPQSSSFPSELEFSNICNNLPNHRLRTSCKYMAEDTLFATMETVYAFVDAKDEDALKLTNASIYRFLSVGIPKPGEHDCETQCPSWDIWSQAAAANERSLSPWRWCNHYDPDRLPQWITSAKCQCSGCINPRIKSEDINFHSAELKVTIPIIRKGKSVATFAECTTKKTGMLGCWEDTLELSLGCQCFWPFEIGG